MKKIYIQPVIDAVVVLQRNQVCTLISASGETQGGGPSMGGQDPNPNPDPNVKGSVNVWDEEW